MFSTWKNWILNTLGILWELGIPLNFWHRKGPEYLYQLFDILPKPQHVNWNHFKYTFTFNNDFMMNRELSFIATINDFGHVPFCWWLTLFLTISFGGQVVEVNFSLINFDKLLKIVSFPASWVMTCIMKMYCSRCITILGYTFQSRIFENS